MAKSRAQRKAERRKRAAQQRASKAGQKPEPESAETPAADEPAEDPTAAPEPAATVAADTGPEVVPVAAEEEEVPEGEDRITRRQRKAEERERKRRAKESEKRRQGGDAPVEKERGAVSTFLRSVFSELGRVQWPDRDTLVQASSVTIVFVAISAAYLGALDAVFSRLIQLII